MQDLLAKHFPDQVSAMDPVFDEDAPRSLKELKDLNKRLNAALLDLSNSCVTGGVFVTDLKVHHEKDVAAGKFSRAASQGGERSAQVRSSCLCTAVKINSIRAGGSCVCLSSQQRHAELLRKAQGDGVVRHVRRQGQGQVLGILLLARQNVRSLTARV